MHRRRDRRRRQHRPPRRACCTTSARRSTTRSRAPHAIIGAELARRYGVAEAVVHCIEAHHEEVEPRSGRSAVIVQMADAISGGRPGARRESAGDTTSSASRRSRASPIASRASRSRSPSRRAARSASSSSRRRSTTWRRCGWPATSARRSKSTMEYPGQIKVTVVRETRATEFATVGWGDDGALSSATSSARPAARRSVRSCPRLRRSWASTVVVANGENAAAGRGLTVKHGEGDLRRRRRHHLLRQPHLGPESDHRGVRYLGERRWLLRPANYPPGAPGRGIDATPALTVINLRAAPSCANID